MTNVWEFLNPKKEKKVLRCVVCGKEVSEDRFHYNYDYKHGLCCCSDECFTKQFWQDALKGAIIINQHSYHLGNENDSYRGMDGHAYKIQLDSGDIYYTTNLWYNGIVPKEYYKGDNARFIR